MSFGLMGSIRLSLPFSAVMLIVRLVVSTSDHLRNASSPMRAPVSLSVCSKQAVFGLPALIRVSSSSSVGMNGTEFSFL